MPAPDPVGERVASLESHRDGHEDRHTRFELHLDERLKVMEADIASIKTCLTSMDTTLRNGGGTGGNPGNGRRRRRDMVEPFLVKGVGGGGLVYLVAMEVVRRLSGS